MYTFIVIFLIFATVLALGTLTYVVVDIILSHKKKEAKETKKEKKEKAKIQPAPVPVVETVVEREPVEEVEPIVVVAPIVEAEPEPEEEPIKEEEPIVVVAPIVVADPEPEEEPVEEVEPIVVPVIAPIVLSEEIAELAAGIEHIDAIEADAILSDDQAMSFVAYERGAGKGRKAEINIGVIDKHFEAGEVITLDILKAKGLISKREKRVKVLADGILTKPFIIKADAFSIEAIKMIELVGGTVIILVS